MSWVRIPLVTQRKEASANAEAFFFHYNLSPITTSLTFPDYPTTYAYVIYSSSSLFINTTNSYTIWVLYHPGIKQKRTEISFDSFWASCRIRTNDPEITNHVLWPTELKRQAGKQSISRRYDLIPLLRSSPGGFKGSWPYRTYPFCECKGSANRTN